MQGFNGRQYSVQNRWTGEHMEPNFRSDCGFVYHSGFRNKLAFISKGANQWWLSQPIMAQGAIIKRTKGV